jgi:aspartyl-tRNA(Asn)/glutamyl-tRNA(Gln) amidotransferase subunit A
MINSSLRELARALVSKQISSVELAQLFLDRAERYNGALNAFITLDPQETLAQARAADQSIARGTVQSLTGIPVALKDIFCAEGWLTTCGSKMLHNFVAPYDAYVVEKAQASRGAHPGQDQHGRVRDGLVERKLPFRSGSQPLGRERRCRRKLRRLGSSGSGLG